MDGMHVHALRTSQHTFFLRLAGRPSRNLFLYVQKFEGHEHACRRSISNQIGTSRIPMIKSIILKGQNMVLTYPRGGLRGKYLKI